MAIAVIFRAPAVILCVVITYSFAQLSQPDLGPRKLDTENRQADRNDHDGWSGRHNHDDTHSENGTADRQYRDPSRNFVCYLRVIFDHKSPVSSFRPPSVPCAPLSFFTALS